MKTIYPCREVEKEQWDLLGRLRNSLTCTIFITGLVIHIR